MPGLERVHNMLVFWLLPQALKSWTMWMSRRDRLCTGQPQLSTGKTSCALPCWGKHGYLLVLHCSVDGMTAVVITVVMTMAATTHVMKNLDCSLVLVWSVGNICLYARTCMLPEAGSRGLPHQVFCSVTGMPGCLPKRPPKHVVCHSSKHRG